MSAAADTITKMASAVATTNFLACSYASKEAGRLANLLKNLNLSALITGEKGVGKTTLAQNITDAAIVNGENLNALLSALGSNSVLIVKNFHKISNYVLLKEALKANPTRLIATSNQKIDEKITDIFFGIKITIPPLSERPEDVEALAQKFYKEAHMLFLGEERERESVDLSGIELDVSLNSYSLKRSVYTAFVVENFKEHEMLNLLEKFFTQKIGGGDDYRKLLYVFDVPMLRAGFTRFHSQLAISKNFGLNRNTLRKKIRELRNFFKNQVI
ncbi:MAG: Fis family transcriptional regulator [Campylobacteraceae bacterium]|nr:Fis family transcriptional regulator [Campylobacteraceae bacterium]